MAAMFMAALVSALLENWQCLHRKTAWLWRLALAQWPQALHVLLVLRVLLCKS